MFGDKHQPVLWHGVLHPFKKIAAQIGRVAVLIVGARIALVEKVPILVADVAPLRRAEGDACVRHLFAFLADFFTFLLR